MRRLLGAAAGSLGANLVVGVKGLAATFVLTLPSGVLWAAAWWGGWNNSFNKGYEQAAIGPMIGLLGVASFVVGASLLPYAQVRLAVSGEWARAFDLRLIWRLLCASPWRSVILAAVFVVASLPVSFALALPFTFSDDPSWLDASVSEAAARLRGYFLLVGLGVFPLFVLAHVIAAKLYSGALLLALRRGRVSASQLSERERDVLDDLVLLPERSDLATSSARDRKWLARWVTLPALGLCALIWFGLVAQVFVGQFFNYRGLRAWVNQPVLQAPWVRSIPPHLRTP